MKLNSVVRSDLSISSIVYIVQINNVFPNKIMLKDDSLFLNTRTVMGYAAYPEVYLE